MTYTHLLSIDTCAHLFHRLSQSPNSPYIFSRFFSTMPSWWTNPKIPNVNGSPPLLSTRSSPTCLPVQATTLHRNAPWANPSSDRCNALLALQSSNHQLMIHHHLVFNRLVISFLSLLTILFSLCLFCNEFPWLVLL
jgi:hypothetical protein